MRPDGKTWAAITDVVRVVALFGGGYSLTCQGEKIELLPVAWPGVLAMPESLVKAGDHHFGPILQAKHAPDWIEWEVIASPAVKRERGQWFWEIDGVKVGLFLDDWIANFGDKCDIRGDTITLDLTAAKAIGGEINMDPAISLSGSAYGYSLIGAGWNAVRNAADSSSALVDEPRSATVWADPNASIVRAGLRFDTSDYSAVVSAFFAIACATKNGSTIRAARASFTDMSAVGTYGEIKTGYSTAANRLGSDAVMTESPSGTYISGNFVDQWESTAKFDIGVVELHDFSGDLPTETQTEIFIPTGASAPYLEIIAERSLISITPSTDTTLAITPSADTTLTITPSAGV